MHKSFKKKPNANKKRMLGLTKKPPGVVTLSPDAVAGIYNMKGGNA
jgi:hypothetical protein